MKGKSPAIATAKTVMASARPGDGGSPSCPEEIEDGRDQGARMGDPDPEDEIDEIGAPHDRVVDARDPHARDDLVAPSRTRPDRCPPIQGSATKPDRVFAGAEGPQDRIVGLGIGHLFER